MAEHRPGASSEHIASGPPPLADANKNGVPVPDPAQAKALPKKAAASETKDSVREIIETVVFVVVLVLLLKSFVAEAFVIPTGSMAETLYGYQKIVKCQECGRPFPVNCSSEVDPQQGSGPTEVVGAICPNCRREIRFDKDFPSRSQWPSYNTGDRVLVAKFVYDLNLGFLDMPERYQVVVFKYPEKPQKDYVPLNYIKRLIGLPRETIAIHYGKLYHYIGLNYDDLDADVPQLELWKDAHMHIDEKPALKLFEDGKFKILRKSAKQVLAERRIVFDNDFQPKDLVHKGEQRGGEKRAGQEEQRWQRWYGKPGDSSWSYDDNDEPRVFKHAARETSGMDWLSYLHLLPVNNRSSLRRELITDFMGYNTWLDATNMRHATPAANWVGDLILECDVEVQQATGELVFELSKGFD